MPTGQVEPHLFVIFGATGDLMKRKLLPAIYQLTAEGFLRDNCYILGVSTQSGLTDDGFRKWANQALIDAGIKTEDLEKWCTNCLYYQPVADEFDVLARRISEIEAQNDLPGNRIFYLALPPAVFPSTITALGQCKLNHSSGWTKLIIEKPFGRDLTSAQKLNALVHQYFDESQIYRIDHYLGKETVQNLLAFRFANSIFESLWNRDRVESVKITVAEELGVEHRGAYYEQAGALRDMVQNHLTQLLTLDRNGSAEFVQCRFDPLREGQSSALDKADSNLRRCLRAVRAGSHRRSIGARILGGAARLRDFYDRDLPGNARGNRQLALARRSLLPANRQEITTPVDAD